MKNKLFLLIFIGVNYHFFSQYISFQGGINSQNGFAYNAGINVSTDFFTYSSNKIIGSSLSYAEFSVLAERNTNLSEQIIYPVFSVGYEYFRKGKKTARDNKSKTGIGLNSNLLYKTFKNQDNQVHLVNMEFSLTYIGVLHLGYGRTIYNSSIVLKKELNPNYLFLRFVFGGKRTLFTIFDLAGGWV